ncbi:unknown protein [Seminavis robusta]|uniref:Uncharacterized protein n=1 Tax=Seminavis robusta TaxID=568900 RepID=A0A9N8F273_9STRA|nr:unknown protein [Seminavis robusta]|eukprot:Sro2948_g340830.1 n/a (410) ;mRNA; f:3173-4762
MFSVRRCSSNLDLQTTLNGILVFPPMNIFWRELGWVGVHDNSQNKFLPRTTVLEIMPKVNSKDDVVTLRHLGGASVDFLVDCLTGITDHPMLRTHNEKAQKFVVDSEVVLQATVLDCVFEKRTFNKATGPISIAKFVLADGSSAVWKAVTSSNLSELVEIEMAKTANSSGMSSIKVDPPDTVEESDDESYNSPPLKRGSLRFFEEEEALYLSTEEGYFSSYVPDVIEDAKQKGDLIFTVPCCLFDPKTNKGLVFQEKATVAQLKLTHPCHVTWNKADFKKLYQDIPEDFDEDATVPMPDAKDAESIGTKRKEPPKEYTTEEVASKKVNMELEEKKERDESKMVVDLEEEECAVKEAFEKESRLSAFHAYTEEVKSISSKSGDYWDNAIRITLEWKNRSKRLDDSPGYSV